MDDTTLKTPLHPSRPLAKFLKQSPAAIDFVQTVCFDADDYDNGLFLDVS